MGYDTEIEKKYHPENFQLESSEDEDVDSFESHDLSMANENTEL